MGSDFWKEFAVQLFAEAVLLGVGLFITALRIKEWLAPQPSSGPGKWNHICDSIWGQFRKSFERATDDEQRRRAVETFDLEREMKAYRRTWRKKDLPSDINHLERLMKYRGYVPKWALAARWIWERHLDEPFDNRANARNACANANPDLVVPNVNQLGKTLSALGYEDEAFE